MPKDHIMEVMRRDPLYEQWRGVGRIIAERQLNDQEIQQLFGNIEQTMTTGGQNRTMIGKGVDTARAVGAAWSSLKNKIYTSAPMAGFATAYDRAAEALKQGTGGDQGLFQYVQKYRDFAEKHPIMQKAVYALLVAAAGVAGASAGPAGIGAAVGLMQTFDKAIQGQDIRSAIWSGTKAGVVAGATAQLADFMRGGKEVAGAAAPAPIAPTGQETVIVQPGDTLSGIAQNTGVSVQDLLAANPQITNPDVIKAGQEIALPGITGNPVYQGGVGTAADTLAKIQSGAYTNSPISQAAAARAGLRESFDRVAAVLPLVCIPKRSMIDRDATVMNWSLNESLGQRRRSVQLTDLGVKTVFENLAVWRVMVLESDAPSAQRLRHHYSRARSIYEQAAAPTAAKPGFFSKMWSGIKSAASAAGRELTTKVTATRLQSNWNKVKEYDSDKLAQWLVDAPQSVPKEVVAQVFQSMNLPVPASFTAPAEPAADPAAVNPDTPAVARAKAALGIAPEPSAASPAAAPAAAVSAPEPTAPVAAPEPSDQQGGAAPVEPTAPAAMGVKEINAAIRQLRTRKDLNRVKNAVDSALAKRPARSGKTTFVSKGKGPMGKIKRNAAVAESLEWSKDFDPGIVLWKNIRG